MRQLRSYENAGNLVHNWQEVHLEVAARLQIRFEFNAVEDRLLLCISKKERHNACVEYRFWLTRRFVNVFIRAIDKLIRDELAADMQITADAIDAMKKFQHEAALSKADFFTSYGADTENCKVFGGKSFLVAILKIKKKSKGRYVLSLLNNENIGIHLTAGMDLLHSLQKMLLDSAVNAGWNRSLFQATDEEPETSGPAGYIS